jgi:hypothetical protein
MDYANDEIFSIRYNQYEDKLELDHKKNKRVLNLVKSNKVLSTLILLTMIAIGVNIIFMNQFFHILLNM